MLCSLCCASYAVHVYVYDVLCSSYCASYAVQVVLCCLCCATYAVLVLLCMYIYTCTHIWLDLGLGSRLGLGFRVHQSGLRCGSGLGFV